VRMTSNKTFLRLNPEHLLVSTDGKMGQALAEGTRSSAKASARGGAEAVTVSIPSRYVHTVNEMANRQDIARAITLLARFLEDAGSRSYGYDQ
jgi:putative aminopeptidase FrvX